MQRSYCSPAKVDSPPSALTFPRQAADPFHCPLQRALTSLATPQYPHALVHRPRLQRQGTCRVHRRRRGGSSHRPHGTGTERLTSDPPDIILAFPLLRGVFPGEASPDGGLPSKAFVAGLRRELSFFRAGATLLPILGERTLFILPCC